MDYKIILGIVATVIGFISYIPYFVDILKNKTKPHIFSWLSWGLLTGIAFFAQVVKGGGPSAWVIGSGAILCFLVIVISFFKGEKNITKIDWFCLGCFILGVLLWKLTNDPLFALVLSVITNLLAFVPTFIKSYRKPWEETMSLYFLSALKWAITLAVITSYSFATIIFPLSLFLTNGLFVVMVLYRKNKINVRSGEFLIKQKRV